MGEITKQKRYKTSKTNKNADINSILSVIALNVNDLKTSIKTKKPIEWILKNHLNTACKSCKLDSKTQIDCNKKGKRYHTYNIKRVRVSTWVLNQDINFQT